MSPPSEEHDVYLDADTISALERRLARIEGHVRGVHKMLGNQRDCDDILTQIAGVRAALDQVALKLLEAHLDSCVASAIQMGDGATTVKKFKASLKRFI